MISGEKKKRRVGVVGFGHLGEMWNSISLISEMPTSGDIKSGALSIRPKTPEIPGWGANGTDIFRNFIPKFREYLARLT